MTNYSLSGGGVSLSGLIIPTAGLGWGIPAGQTRTYDPPKRSESALLTDGAFLIKKASPIASQASLVGAVAELLKDGIPEMLFSSIMKVASSRKRDTIKALAGDYLNYMFAVSPTINDIKKLIEAIMKLDRQIKQLKRDSGKDIFRSRGLPNSETTNESTLDSPASFAVALPTSGISQPLTGNYLWGNPSLSPVLRGSATTRDTRETWFTGSFTYYLERLLPPKYMTDFFGSVLQVKDFSMLNDILIGEYLIGASPENFNISVGWQLTPFSWLVDWFADVGTVIDNANTFNNLGLVMNYGYLMCKETRDISMTLNMRDGSSQSAHWRYERKRRRRANPFGFGLTDSSLSTTQQSLLGALVLSRK